MKKLVMSSVLGICVALFVLSVTSYLRVCPATHIDFRLKMKQAQHVERIF